MYDPQPHPYCPEAMRGAWHSKMDKNTFEYNTSHKIQILNIQFCNSKILNSKSFLVYLMFFKNKSEVHFFLFFQIIGNNNRNINFVYVLSIQIWKSTLKSKIKMYQTCKNFPEPNMPINTIGKVTAGRIY